LKRVDPITNALGHEKTRKELRQAAVAAWESYLQTSLHATFEEADAWLAELESGSLTEPPPLHT
jgi:predicted transcriptional regulator